MKGTSTIIITGNQTSQCCIAMHGDRQRTQLRITGCGVEGDAGPERSTTLYRIRNTIDYLPSFSSLFLSLSLSLSTHGLRSLIFQQATSGEGSFLSVDAGPASRLMLELVPPSAWITRAPGQTRRREAHSQALSSRRPVRLILPLFLLSTCCSSSPDTNMMLRS